MIETSIGILDAAVRYYDAHAYRNALKLFQILILHLQRAPHSLWLACAACLASLDHIPCCVQVIRHVLQLNGTRSERIEALQLAVTALCNARQTSSNQAHLYAFLGLLSELSPSNTLLTLGYSVLYTNSYALSFPDHLLKNPCTEASETLLYAFSTLMRARVAHFQGDLEDAIVLYKEALGNGSFPEVTVAAQEGLLLCYLYSYYSNKGDTIEDDMALTADRDNLTGLYHALEKASAPLSDAIVLLTGLLFRTSTVSMMNVSTRSNALSSLPYFIYSPSPTVAEEALLAMISMLKYTVTQDVNPSLDSLSSLLTLVLQAHITDENSQCFAACIPEVFHNASLVMSNNTQPERAFNFALVSIFAYYLRDGLEIKCSDLLPKCIRKSAEPDEVPDVLAEDTVVRLEEAVNEHWRTADSVIQTILNFATDPEGVENRTSLSQLLICAPMDSIYNLAWLCLQQEKLQTALFLSSFVQRMYYCPKTAILAAFVLETMGAPAAARLAVLLGPGGYRFLEAPQETTKDGQGEFWVSDSLKALQPITLAYLATLIDPSDVSSLSIHLAPALHEHVSGDSGISTTAAYANVALLYLAAAKYLSSNAQRYFMCNTHHYFDKLDSFTKKLSSKKGCYESYIQSFNTEILAKQYDYSKRIVSRAEKLGKLNYFNGLHDYSVQSEQQAVLLLNVIFIQAALFGSNGMSATLIQKYLSTICHEAPSPAFSAMGLFLTGCLALDSQAPSAVYFAAALLTGLKKKQVPPGSINSLWPTLREELQACCPDILGYFIHHGTNLTAELFRTELSARSPDKGQPIPLSLLVYLSTGLFDEGLYAEAIEIIRYTYGLYSPLYYPLLLHNALEIMFFALKKLREICQNKEYMALRQMCEGTEISAGTDTIASILAQAQESFKLLSTPLTEELAIQILDTDESLKRGDDLLDCARACISTLCEEAHQRLVRYRDAITSTKQRLERLVAAVRGQFTLKEDVLITCEAVTFFCDKLLEGGPLLGRNGYPWFKTPIGSILHRIGQSTRRYAPKYPQTQDSTDNALRTMTRKFGVASRVEVEVRAFFSFQHYVNTTPLRNSIKDIRGILSLLETAGKLLQDLSQQTKSLSDGIVNYSEQLAVHLQHSRPILQQRKIEEPPPEAQRTIQRAPGKQRQPSISDEDDDI
ncbi:hypothetical protein GMRT_10391 [Giardia muris]|uniref:Uncharacterized protein n=1 Tax=Giardia muris TaxID=5742 RepID=A0A4Z1T3W1_GIAMU|nr:hypothetical protein GMRT_10391 [Giardia muris]|eukprot:TNJ30338.1 hypothetical protein GMRT_10391 [Giardia muris]